MSRPTLSTVGVTVALAALIVGVVVSIDESHHHRASTPNTSGGVQLPATALAQQLKFAHKLNTMTLPKGVAHTTTCPQAATLADACFSAPLHSPVPTELTAAGDIQSLLKSLHIAIPGRVTVTCIEVPGGPQGSGYNCTTNGTWRTATVAVTAFVSNAAHKYPDAGGISAMVSIKTIRPS